jgi:hypothetical protein
MREALRSSVEEVEREIASAECAVKMLKTLLEARSNDRYQGFLASRGSSTH